MFVHTFKEVYLVVRDKKKEKETQTQTIQLSHFTFPV